MSYIYSLGKGVSCFKISWNWCLYNWWNTLLGVYIHGLWIYSKVSQDFNRFEVINIFISLSTCSVLKKRYVLFNNTTIYNPFLSVLWEQQTKKKRIQLKMHKCLFSNNLAFLVVAWCTRDYHSLSVFFSIFFFPPLFLFGISTGSYISR